MAHSVLVLCLRTSRQSLFVLAIEWCSQICVSGLNVDSVHPGDDKELVSPEGGTKLRMLFPVLLNNSYSISKGTQQSPSFLHTEL